MLNQEVTLWTSFKASLYGQQWLITLCNGHLCTTTFHYFNYADNRHLIDRVTAMVQQNLIYSFSRIACGLYTNFDY